LVRDLQIKKLRNITANKKRRSKQTIGCTVINSEK
jgi:predicted ATP-grasp superfamily ATP-dependent carboligase